MRIRFKRGDGGRAAAGVRWARWFPPAEWVPRYRRADFAGDLPSGITVGAMLIPQGMAYALLAGLPPQVGLYAATLPLVVYALLGRSRQLGIGPTAISSLLAAAGLAPLAGGDPARYAALAAGLAVMVGVIRIALGVARLGFAVNFLSGPVLTGFTAAAAVVISLSQLKHLLGIPLTDSSRAYDVLTDAIRRLDETHLLTLGLGAAAVALLLGLGRIRPAWPAALVVVVVGAAAGAFADLENRGVRVVGEIPRGLPALEFPTMTAEEAQALLPTALAITVLGFVESIAIAKVFARRLGYSIRVNQELVAVGAATAAAGVVGGYPVSGSFSRTAVNARAGARTQAAGVISAAVVAVIVVVAAPLFETLPRVVLAAVVITAVAGLVDVREARRLWRVKRSDCALLMVAFAGTLLLGVEWGLGLAVIASLVEIVRQVSYPHTAVLGRLPGSSAFRNVERAPEAQTIPGVAVIRFDAPLYFANVEFLREQLRKVELRAESPVRAIVLDASSITDLDSSGEMTLADLASDYEARGIAFFLSRVKGPVLDVLIRSGLYDRMGGERFPHTNDQAVRRAEAALDEPALDLAKDDSDPVARRRRAPVERLP